MAFSAIGLIGGYIDFTLLKFPEKLLKYTGNKYTNTIICVICFIILFVAIWYKDNKRIIYLICVLLFPKTTGPLEKDLNLPRAVSCSLAPRRIVSLFRNSTNADHLNPKISIYLPFSILRKMNMLFFKYIVLSDR